MYSLVGGRTILHYSGPPLITWSSSSIPTQCVQIHDVPAVWACPSVNAIWGSSPTDVFAVGDYENINHFNGITWSVQGYFNPLGPWHWWYGIWGSSGNNVFAVGYGAITNVYRYDGSVWSSMTSGTTTQLNGIWGSSGSDVFAVGGNGSILHYDGSVWSPMTSGTTQTLYGIWGSSGSDVFAVGVNGTILHYDGSVWAPMTSGTTTQLNGIWGSSGSDIFVVGNNGTIFHYDGSVWSPMTSGTTQTLRGIWGSSGSDVFAVGNSGTILHYDGTVTTTTVPPTTTSSTTTTTPPTVISLVEFNATPGNSIVTFTWSTASEIDNSGFNLYRSETENGEYIKINSSIIQAKGSSTQGANYEFIDNNVQNRKTYYYKLEDIDLNGQSTMHGPVSATPRWILGIFGR